MVTMIYKTDCHHSYASRDIIGIVINTNPVHLIQEHIKKEGEELSEDDHFNLIHYKQTQGYNGEGEYQFEHITTDVLL